VGRVPLGGGGDYLVKGARYSDKILHNINVIIIIKMTSLLLNFVHFFQKHNPFSYGVTPFNQKFTSVKEPVSHTYNQPFSLRPAVVFSQFVAVLLRC
jgi:hypothetical protein